MKVRSTARDAVHVLFADEKVKPDDPVPAPEVSEVEEIQHHRTVRLDALVRMKLTAFRDKDRMHLRDMIDVELVKESYSTIWHPKGGRGDTRRHTFANYFLP
jgi:hypothetical protein